MKQSIGSFAKATIAANGNKSNEELLAIVKNEFPNAKTSVNCIAWYKSDMKKKGQQMTTVVIERTVEVVQQELEDAKLQVVALEEELQELTVATREKLEQEFARLAKLLNKEVA
jgi:hypothetical protein